MGGTHVGSSDTSPGPQVPQLGQVGEDLSEHFALGSGVSGNKLSCEQAADVFEEHERGFHLADNPGDVVPEIPGVLCGSSASGEGERLARESGRDDIHSATPRATVERSHVIPDRSRGQAAVEHACRQDPRDIGFPLDVTNTSVGISEGKSEPEFEPSSPGTKSHAIHSFSEGLSCVTTV
jgi:hypothetical protein